FPATDGRGLRARLQQSLTGLLVVPRLVSIGTAVQAVVIGVGYHFWSAWMHRRRAARAAARATTIALLLLLSCATTTMAQSHDWPITGGEPGNSRYSTLDQINV